jgi:DNA-nicking Smr family endonuclease
MPRTPDDDRDDEAFRRAMADVVPIEPDARGRVKERPPVTAASPVPETQDASDESGDYAAAGIDRRELRKLRRGDYPVEERLDLHGQTVREACDAVERFIKTSRYARRRCVCIVHGKGLNSATGASALRDPVRERLRSTTNVLAYATARSSDGGSGAIYVLLRRM